MRRAVPLIVLAGCCSPRPTEPQHAGMLLLLVSEALTRDVSGQWAGGLEYDADSNAITVRDFEAVQQRVEHLLKRHDQQQEPLSASAGVVHRCGYIEVNHGCRCQGENRIRWRERGIHGWIETSEVAVQGKAISLAMRDAPAREVVDQIAQLAGVVINCPQIEDRVALSANEVPWPLLLSAVVRSAGHYAAVSDGPGRFQVVDLRKKLKERSYEITWLQPPPR